MITLATIKTLLNITTTDYDAQLTLLIPMVENDVRRILNNQFNERVDCEFENGSTTISNLWNLRSAQTERYFQYTSSKLTNPVEIGRILQHPNIPEEAYITAYDEENGIATISQATTGDGDYVISSITYGMLIPIAKMVGFKLNGMSRQVCDGEIASKSMGPVSVSYVQHIDKRWGYPMDILRDLGTPIQRVG
ncbi:MAG: phage head-tail connector protein [Synergistaceae bacterium]|nr:phage head-tail connector protein [Synergistaceae bacterium]